MAKKIIIFLFIFPIFILGMATTTFINSEKIRSLIISSFNLESVINKKIKSFVSRKLDDTNILIKINSLKLLKPDWPNIVKIELNDVDVYTINRVEKSKINLIELGFSYEDVLRNIFFNRNYTSY